MIPHAILLAFLALSASPAHVSRVIDGDTFVVQRDGEEEEVRVLGIDCPESHRNQKCRREGTAACEAELPAGLSAASRARELLQGQDVTLEPMRPGRTVKVGYRGRLQAFVRLADGRDFGLVMIEEGLCADYGWKYPHPREAEYRAAQAAVVARKP